MTNEGVPVKEPKTSDAQARSDYGNAVTGAFAAVADAIAAGDPELSRDECVLHATYVLQETARQVRSGHITIPARTAGSSAPDAGLLFPGTGLDDQAERLFTLARWCRNSARAELGARGWDAGQEAAFTRSFEDLVDNWTTYKCVLAFLAGADGAGERPTREQVLADLEKPRRAFAGALAAYGARLLEAAGHAARLAALFDVKRAAADQDHQGTVTLPAAGTEK
jgi:hypothetical protein